MEEESRRAPPPVPPRVDLGETEGVLPVREDDGLIDSSANVNGHESFSGSPDVLMEDENVHPPKPLHSTHPKSSVTSKPEPHSVISKPELPSVISTPELPSVIKPDPYSVKSKPRPPSSTSKPGPPAVNKSAKPSKKQEKGRPEITIVSARPMDQSTFVHSTDSRSDMNVPTPNGTGDNNNASNKAGTTENKRPTKPAPPAPKKPPPYNPKTGASSAKPFDSSASSRVAPTPSRATKPKSINKDTSTSIFYIDPTPEDNLKQKEKERVTFSKTDDKPNVKLKPSLPAPRKNKTKQEQSKKTAETDTSTSRKQTEATLTKPKFKPTIITAKKPKEVGPVAKETKSFASMKEGPSLNNGTSSPTSVEIPAEENPPERPDFPPGTEVEQFHESPQPQRPKVPPNTVHEDQKHRGPNKKDEGQKDFKNDDSVQRKGKTRPRRPPMAKDTAKMKPARPAPAQPSVGSKKQPTAKPKKRDSSTKKAQPVPEVKPPKQEGPARATAKYDYTGETTDDLSFKVGDTILLTSKVDEEWFVGYLENNVMHQGLFPANFVDVVVPLKETTEEKIPVPSLSEPHAVAVHNFQGQSDGELSFSSGQKIILIERINEEWLKGKVDTTVGIFPQNFVRVERDLPQPTTDNKEIVDLPNSKTNSTKPSGMLCRAIHDFQGKHDDDLSFVIGNEIKIIEKLNENWFKGEFSGKSGIFPASFVEIIAQAVESSKGNLAVVTALFDYPGGSPEDLSFSAGDRIEVVERIDSDWLLGKLNGKEGLFPVSFVEGVPETLPESATSNGQQPKNIRLAKAVHDFSGEHPGELHFRAGDTIEVLREIDNSWCEGMVNNVTGIFPTSFVEMELLQPKEVSHAKALYDFEGDSPQDLSFKAGDVIQLLEPVNEDWWTGSFGGKTGHFPATFVEIMTSSS